MGFLFSKAGCGALLLALGVLIVSQTASLNLSDPLGWLGAGLLVLVVVLLLRVDWHVN